MVSIFVVRKTTGIIRYSFSYEGEHKYFRYLSPDWSRSNMAELYTFDAAGDTQKSKRLLGNFHVRPWRRFFLSGIVLIPFTLHFFRRFITAEPFQVKYVYIAFSRICSRYFYCFPFFCRE